ncbi:unnamed protein product [Larinioides sclopetarius]|uniref:Uncharacterized protein n=1 Tax=Larinioides sclopetarius TaxID=280406 RepID=A0AAV2AYQ8_9ARAC
MHHGYLPYQLTQNSRTECSAYVRTCACGAASITCWMPAESGAIVQLICCRRCAWTTTGHSWALFA